MKKIHILCQKVNRQGTNQEVKELVALIDMIGNLLEEKIEENSKEEEEEERSLAIPWSNFRSSIRQQFLKARSFQNIAKKNFMFLK